MASQDTPTPVVIAFEDQCSIAEMKNLYPCLNCLSESQLEMLLLYMWAYVWSLEDSIVDLLSNATDGQNISRSDFLRMEIAIMARSLLSDDVTVNDLIDDVKCLPCARSDVIRATILKLKCEYWQLAE